MSNQTSIIHPLPRAEVIKAVERRNPIRIPLVRAKWWSDALRAHHGEQLNDFDRYPEDAVHLFITPVKYDEMGLSWEIHTEGSLDSLTIIDDWAKLDEFIAKLPDPETDPQIDQLVELAEQARAQDRYVLFGWWRFFFERPWQIRGMSNLLMDYYIAPDQVHRLNDALCTLYCGYIERAARLLDPDGFWTGDDLGHQTQPFMRPQTFHEFLKPYYARVGQALKKLNMHWWLHSCGNNTPLLPDLIDAGLNVLHPVQKHTMDEVAVAREFGDRLTFLAGIDVQHILQERDPDGVREEMRFLIDTFDRPGGGMCIAAGNAIVPGTPLENIEAFLDEAVKYGTEHRRNKRICE